MDDSTEKNKNFFKHVFNFDDDSRKRNIKHNPICIIISYPYCHLE